MTTEPTEARTSPFPEYLTDWAKRQPSMLRHSEYVTGVTDDEDVDIDDLVRDLAQVVYHWTTERVARLDPEATNHLMTAAVVLNELSERGLELTWSDADTPSLKDTWAEQDAERGENPGGGFADTDQRVMVRENDPRLPKRRVS